MSAAGFELVAHVESDATAAESYAVNFRPPPGIAREAWAQPRDMVVQTADQLVRELGLAGGSTEAFDVLAAGLPCQAFARIGRSKLRSLASDEEAFRNDPRAKLYRRFLEYVEAVQPVAIVIENVPDILNFGGHNVPEEICDALEERGYRVAYTLLNAAFHGVPQVRERLFLIALDRSLGIRPAFPEASHSAQLPAGYKGSRTVALRHVPVEGSRFVSLAPTDAGLPPPVSARAALSDLPFIVEHFRDPSTMRRRRVCDRLLYRTFADLSPYGRLMREWRGFRSHGEVSGNVVRLTPRDFPIFRQMHRGADYPQALKVAETLFQQRLEAEAILPAPGTARWNELRRECVPPYDPGKFPNKWWKLDPDLPSRTLTAHMGRDTYSHIHWDSRQQRTLSVREAARLQSFPDGFVFAGSMNAAFRQIGNAVPPLLALAVAKQLRKDLMREPAERNTNMGEPASDHRADWLPTAQILEDAREGVSNI